MNVIVNIGLNHPGGQWSVEKARDALYHCLRTHDLNGVIVACHVYDSDTEPTVVAVVALQHNAWRIAHALELVATALAQEAVAVYNPENNVGILIGPKAEQWGPFNPEFFIMPSGQRLAAKAA